MSEEPDIKYLFEPRAIAIIGASQSTDKIGYKILENILFSEYRGKIYPVNPSGGEILGLKVYKTLSEISDQLDMAVIVIPAKFVFDAVKECVDKGVKFLPIISSGFSETGNIDEEKKIVAYANEHGARILGPNIFGIYSAKVSLNATFGPRNVQRGNVAIVSQSGALGIAMIGKTAVENIGLSAIVSVGNKADISEIELLQYLVKDKDTKIILMYIEGIQKGDQLVDFLEETTKKKPVIVIKSGRSKRGAIAAASHTGSLAGSDEIFSDVMKQCGVMRAETIEEALNWSKFIANSPKPKGENTVIITNGGGIGVLAADACEKFDVALLDDTETLKKIFSEVVPVFGSMKNPIDLTGQATTKEYEKALSAALKKETIHAIICLGCEAAVFDAENFSRTIERMFLEEKFTKPVVFSLLGGAKVEESISALRKKNVPIFPDVYEAVSCFGAMYANYRNEKYPKATAELAPEKSIDAKAITAIIENARKDNRKFLLAHESQKIASLVGIQTPKSFIAKNIDEAVEFAEKIKYPVVMKVVSKSIVHKSDIGGIALDLDNKAEVIDAYEAIMHNCKINAPNAIIEGIEVAQQVKKGIEAIVGARRDNSFGPVVMFGSGGIYVEFIKDVSFRAFPLSRDEIMRMLHETKLYPLLLGARGESKKDIESVVNTILSIGTLIEKFKVISDIEINPLVVYDQGEGAIAVDVRILISQKEVN